MQTNNLQIAPSGIMPRVNVSQYDNDREVHFLLFDGSSIYTPPTGAEIRVEGTKKDGNGFSYECTYSGNNVTVTIKSQMTVFAGDVLCELRISKGDLDIGTLNFILGVEEGALADDIPISDTEIPAIIELAKGEQFNAEAWAQGTKDGVPVTSSDPQYHNNAKYWAEHSQGGNFANLADVDLDNLQNGQVPKYNSSTQKWENADDAGGVTTFDALTDVDIDTPLNGQVPVYNSSTEKWENQNAPSGGLLPHFKVHSEHGSVVTVTYPDGVTTVTATETSSGLYECDVTEFGTYTIDAVLSGDDAQVHQAVDAVKIYDIYDEHYSYAINVYAPSGSTILVTASGESYSGTGAGSTAVVFAVHQASTTYTVQVTIDGQSKTDTITSAASTGGSGNVTIDFGTINVTYDDEFRGETVTCTLSGTTITKTAPSSGNSMAFYPPTTGTWVIASGGHSVNAVVSSLSTAVSVSLQSTIQQTVTIYSAKEDTISYVDIDGATQTITFASGESSKQVTIEIEPSGSAITFTSGVAKDPSNLSNYYSKTVTITSNTTEVYLMPDNALYWWGYIDNNCDALSTGNGWSISIGAYEFVDPTFNSNNIQVTGSAGKVQGVGNKTALSITKIHSIANQTSSDTSYGLYVLVAGNKTITGGNTLNFNTPNTMQYKSANITGSYVSAHRIDARSGYFYALWYE